MYNTTYTVDCPLGMFGVSGNHKEVRASLKMLVWSYQLEEMGLQGSSLTRELPKDHSRQVLGPLLDRGQNEPLAWVTAVLPWPFLGAVLSCSLCLESTARVT